MWVWDLQKQVSTCKTVVNEVNVTFCVLQMGCEYLPMEMMERWIISKYWQLHISFTWNIFTHKSTNQFNNLSLYTFRTSQNFHIKWVENKTFNEQHQNQFVRSWVLLNVLLVVGFLLCHSSLNSNQASQELWKMALRSGLYLTLTRDEVLNIHKVSEDLFDGIKGYGSCSAAVYSSLLLLIKRGR